VDDVEALAAVKVVVVVAVEEVVVVVVVAVVAPPPVVELVVVVVVEVEVSVEGQEDNSPSPPSKRSQHARGPKRTTWQLAF